MQAHVELFMCVSCRWLCGSAGSPPYVLVLGVAWVKHTFVEDHEHLCNLALASAEVACCCEIVRCPAMKVVCAAMKAAMKVAMKVAMKLARKVAR